MRTTQKNSRVILTRRRAGGWLATLAITAALAATAVFAQAPASGDKQQTPAFKAGAEETVLDVVVRDKKGRLVKDLNIKAE